jgi:GNAT superfamily N-acetyltransferase
MGGVVAVTGNDLERFCSLPGLSPLMPEIVVGHQADASLMYQTSGGEVAARCSLWWSNTPRHAGHRLGLIGHYAVRDAAAAATILEAACGELAARGCTLAVAPMDGNTWRRYRFLTDRGSEPVFFLEPDNPDDWPQHLRHAGFTVLAEYYSARSSDLSYLDPRCIALAQRAEEMGVVFRQISLDHFDEELRRIHQVSLASFADNFLYTPIDETEFVAMYKPLRRHLEPRLITLAECSGQLLGFAFAIADLLQGQRGQEIDTVVLKSMAVVPKASGLGLGTLLMARSHEAARRLGFRRVIHALMHEDNRTRQMSAHTAQTIRRYALFARPLGGDAA